MIAAVLAAAAFAGSPALKLRPCELPGAVRARCGQLAVREDRSRPGGRKIKLFVGVLRAFGPRPHKEPLFYLSGGPGGAAASGDAAFAARVFTSANERRDIVLVDQRGVGRSAPLVCKTIPQTVDEAKTCIRGLGRDPRLYTTDAAADDLDVVRQALHYRRIVLYGGSYGGTAAQVYIARHGSRAAAAVLDGATLLDIPIFERLPFTTQRAFDRLAGRCAAEKACSAAFPNVRSDLQNVLGRLRRAPLVVAGSTFGASEAQDTLRLLLRVPATAVRVPKLVHAAAAGDYSGLLSAWEELVFGEQDGARQLMYWSIVCGEGWARLDAGEARRWGADTEFLEASLEGAATRQAVCSLLGPPFPAPDTGTALRSSVPVLFLVGAMDPQDPLENVEPAQQTLPNAQILVVAGAAHGAVQYGCLPRVVARFFSARRLGPADRACSGQVQPPPFDLP